MASPQLSGGHCSLASLELSQSEEASEESEDSEEPAEPDSSSYVCVAEEENRDKWVGELMTQVG